MKEDANDQESAQVAQSIANGVDVSDYEAQIAKRDGLVKELEVPVADAAKTAEATERLKSQIEELKA